MLQFVIGGEKSGKSAFALDLLTRSPAPHLLFATGRPGDLSFRRQIQAHRDERGPQIPVQEVGADMPEALALALKQGVQSVLVDCLDFWLFHFFHAGEPEMTERRERLLEVLDSAQGEKSLSVIFVSCEIGLGPIAADASTRRFVRELGALNQAVSSRCHEAYMMFSGMPLKLKDAEGGAGFAKCCAPERSVQTGQGE